VQKVRDLPGVKVATHGTWFGGKDPKHDNEFFATIAIDAKSTFDVYPEVSVPPAQKEAWLSNRRGMLVGTQLANKLGWKVGDKVILQSGIYGGGDWEFTVDALYVATRKGINESQLFFHWDYLNERISAGRKDNVGWIIARIDDPSKATEISTTIDKMFDENEIQTLSQDEHAFQASFLGMFSAVLTAINWISVAILVIMVLILGNTIAMGVRERTSEYGVLRAIGFVPGQVAAFVLGESALVALFGGIFGLALSYPIVERGLGRFLEDNMGAFFPWFRIDPKTALLALGLSVVLGLVAAAIPAFQASKVSVIDALRKVG
jgi:putative ABC transport system permease protein